MSQNVIELNGKRYDAITGAYLGKSHVVPEHIRTNFAKGKVIDGFMRPAHPSMARPKPAAKPVMDVVPAVEMPAKVEAKARAAQPQTHHKSHTEAAHVKAHKPERSKTLMRRATTKPHFEMKKAIHHTQAPAEIMAKPASAIAVKRSAYGVDHDRQTRALATLRHQNIRHFHPSGKPPALHTVSQDVPTIPVRAAPVHTPRPQPDIFERAIANANSHQQPAHKVRRHRSHHRLKNSLAIVATFLVIGSFVTYLNLPQLQLRFASMQAGFGASMPSYLPTGYALEDGVQRSGGTISLSFRSGDSNFRITQQSSDWNSQTLLDNTLALNGQHETVEKNGQTIFVYDNSTRAAWVNGGVRYDISGNAQLSSDEIVSIAASL